MRGSDAIVREFDWIISSAGVVKVLRYIKYLVTECFIFIKGKRKKTIEQLYVFLELSTLLQLNNMPIGMQQTIS